MNQLLGCMHTRNRSPYFLCWDMGEGRAGGVSCKAPPRVATQKACSKRRTPRVVCKLALDLRRTIVHHAAMEASFDECRRNQKQENPQNDVSFIRLNGETTGGGWPKKYCITYYWSKSTVSLGKEKTAPCCIPSTPSTPSNLSIPSTPSIPRILRSSPSTPSLNGR